MIMKINIKIKNVCIAQLHFVSQTILEINEGDM